MKKTSTILTVIMLIVSIASCKKKFDNPPLKIMANSGNINIASLKGMFAASNVKFTTDLNVYCTVIADEVSGNFYKEVYVHDATGAINLKLLSSGGLYIGDSIRMNLRGAVLKLSNGMLVLDSIDVDKMVVKQKSGLNPQPKLTTLAALNSGTASTGILVGELVRIENVEFLEKDSTYAYPSTQTFANRTLKDCNGKSSVVYTSGYSNFAGQRTPTGNGTFIGIVKVYNAAPELAIRNVNEINMTGPTCNTGSYLVKDFSDNSVTSGGWSKQNVVGSINWTTNSYTSVISSPITKITNSSSTASETWLISPPVDLNSSINPNLYFDNAFKATGPQLQVWVSTNYVSGLPSTATWTQITGGIYSAGNYAFVNSGALSLSEYRTNNVRVAFKFIGSASSTSTWELDNITIREN